MGKPLNAYVRERYLVEPAGNGPLDGYTFAVKDVIDLEGHTNTAGNPSWKRTHSPAAAHAPVIRRLLDAGALLHGITHTDELMYSLNGDNFHYGTPLNPLAPDSLPGGSSSGSAAAVAAGAAGFGVGTDTGGSVRIPSSYCGLFGIRPTHGAVSPEGVIPLAPSFDTVGWMAREAAVLRRVGEVLVELGRGTGPAGGVPAAVYAPRELWKLADDGVRDALLPLAEALSPEWTELLQDVEAESWPACFRTLQAFEIWQQHGAWIDRVKPRFGADVAGRFEMARGVSREEYERQTEVRVAIRHQLEELLNSGAVLVFPTAPCPAPRIGLDARAMDRIRSLLLRYTCPAGLSGLPQVTVPVKGPEGRPIGLSLLGGRFRDLELLRLAEEWTSPGGIWAGRAGFPA
ncbi:amidase [Gorillibacterium sp. sgz5001074]|uniref:amidase n=1 Tax=Gorillibacterium sp. sgz5001074 TaxID=3446695 RepID=UPI003F670790